MFMVYFWHILSSNFKMVAVYFHIVIADALECYKV